MKLLTKTLLVDDDTELYDKINKKSNKITYCSNLVDSIKEIQNPNNSFDIAIIDLRFDLSKESLSEGPYGWILLPLIYEYHPNCKITLNSNSAFEGPTIKKAHFGYKVANLSSKRKNPLSSDLSEISAKGILNLPDEISNLIEYYSGQIKNKSNTQKGLRFMDAVALELTVATKQYAEPPFQDNFQYWNLLKTGKKPQGKEQPFFCNDYRRRRIHEIKRFIVKKGLKSNDEVKAMDAQEIIGLLTEENLLINSENLSTFNRNHEDKEWLVLTAKGETTGRIGRDFKCKELTGISQKKLYNYIEAMHTELFGQPLDGEEIPGRLMMAQKICKHLKIEY